MPMVFHCLAWQRERFHEENASSGRTDLPSLTTQGVALRSAVMSGAPREIDNSIYTASYAVAWKSKTRVRI
jgi:hypothetical protein